MSSGQEGGIGRHTVPPRKPKGQQQFKNKKQPELTENRTVWKSDKQGDKEETFIQTRRRGGDRQWGRDRQPGRENSWQGEGWWTQRGGGLWSRLGKAAAAGKAAAGGPGKRPSNPGFQCREIKPQTTD